MKATGKIIGRLIVGCSLACCLTLKIHAQIPPPPDGGTNSSGTNIYNPFDGFNPTPVITYPTNVTLKWYLQFPNTPYTSLLTLAPDGTLYVPIGTGGSGGGRLYAISTSLVDTNDTGYPQPDNFEKWIFYEGTNAGGTITPIVTTDHTVYYSSTYPIMIATLSETNGFLVQSISLSGFSSPEMNPPTLGSERAIYMSSGY